MIEIKPITAGTKIYNSNNFGDFLHKGWEITAFEGYQILVKLGLRPPSDVFPPPIEVYKDWNEKNPVTVAPKKRDAVTVKRDGIDQKRDGIDQKRDGPLTTAERSREYRKRVALVRKLVNSGQ